jgi:hypothetical protein
MLFSSLVMNAMQCIGSDLSRCFYYHPGTWGLNSTTRPFSAFHQANNSAHRAAGATPQTVAAGIALSISNASCEVCGGENPSGGGQVPVGSIYPRSADLVGSWPMVSTPLHCIYRLV